MKKALVLTPALLLSCVSVSLVPAFCYAQEEISPAPLERIEPMQVAETLSAFELPPARPDPASLPAKPVPATESSSRVGVGVKVGTLGAGGEVAVRVLHSANVRFSFSGLSFGYNFNRDGIDYGAKLRMEGAQATFDYFLIGGFHISPGALLYNGTQVTGTAAVPSGSTFTLNSVAYESGATNPVTGSVAVTFRKVAPVLLFGFGNLVPRGRRHWSITSDFGVAFSGSPNATLNLTGMACLPGTTSGPTCLDVASNATVQSNVIAEQSSINSKMSFFRIYPVVTLGFGWAF